MTTEREQAIRDCIAATKAATDSYELVRPATIIAVLRSVLSAPDPAEASNPSQSAAPPSTATEELAAPADHGPAAGGDGEAGTCKHEWHMLMGYSSERCRHCFEIKPPKDFEDGVRACIEALPCMKPEGHVIWGKTREDAFVDGLTQCHKALEALLPKPDKAKELARSLIDEDEAMSRDYSAGFFEACRRLLSTGRLAE